MIGELNRINLNSLEVSQRFWNDIAAARLRVFGRVVVVGLQYGGLLVVWCGSAACWRPGRRRAGPSLPAGERGSAVVNAETLIAQDEATRGFTRRLSGEPFWTIIKQSSTSDFRRPAGRARG